MRNKIFLTIFSIIIPFTPALAGDSKSVTLHGYGEVHSNNTINGSRKLDLHRTVIGVGADFSDKIHYSMEVDFEHSFAEPELEFAYVDLKINPNLTIRAGDMLMPVGSLNEFHEPPLFWSVERPYLHKDIIPTTWQAIGGGPVVSLLDQTLNFRIYMVNGMDGFKIR
ncbi:MAG: hypothetical protein ABIA63_14820 [bacterium]